METLVTVRNGLALTTLLLPLLLLTGCKQGDTQPLQKPDKRDVAPVASINKSAADAVEKRKNLASVAAPKPVPMPGTPAKNLAEPQQKMVNSAKESKALPAAAESTAKKPPSQKPKAAPPAFGPDDPRSGIYLSITGKMARMGDPSGTASDAYKYGQGNPPEALAGVGLPKDKFGLIDWMAIVNEGIIKPRGSIKPGVPEMPPFDMNVLITAKGDFVNDVMFPHKAHTYWLKCENCHTGIFIMAKGKNKMTMQGIVEGKWCGRCHGKVAFPLTDCNRCHQTPKQTVEITAKK
ncbi:MAG: hypothetical protein L3J26_05195 [Candidatus Polarisedimenticolaceae bacterium]|nr:hypothetical protein [Candidatus Polarisedimenticolaceae bacterium]